MMYVTLKRADGSLNQHTWHIGQTPLRQLMTADDVCMVQADGDELDMIHRNLDGIRKAVKQRVVIWRGDDAKFIVGNL